MKRTLTVLLVCITAALLIAPAASADDVANETEPEIDEQIDEYAHIKDWSYHDGTFDITLNATEPTTVAVLPPLGGDEEGSANFEPRQVTLTGEDSRTISVDARGDVMLVTEHFFDTGSYATLDRGSDALIGGPWTHTDAQHSAIGAALAIATGVLWKVLKRKAGLDLEPKVIA